MPTPSVLPHWQRVLAVATPPVVVLAVAWVLFTVISWRNDATERVQRTHLVLTQMAELQSRLVDGESAERGFIITGDSAYLPLYYNASADVELVVADLRLSLAGDAAQLAAFTDVAAVVRRRMEVLDARIVLRADRGLDAARAAVMAEGGRELMARLRSLLAGLEQAENDKLAAFQSIQTRADIAVLVSLLVGVVLVISAALLTARILTAHERSLRHLNSELMLANTQLQDQAVELEMQTQELQAQSTHLEELAAELEASNDELQRTAAIADQRSRESESANRAKTDFLAAMSHELRTPLNAITGYVDLLELGIHGELNDMQRASLERVRYNAKHLLVLINDILNFAKLEAGSIELRPSRLDVDALLKETVQLVGPLLDAKGIEFEYGVLPSATLVVADRDRIHQVLFNLLTNAIKYSSAGGRVSLSADTDDGAVHIRVRDTGPGIPAEMQERIFDPFVQLRRGAGGGLSDGVGLGLAISRELARAMHGDLSVHSEPGAGATFTLTLRRAEAPVTVVMMN
jgi:signal transduction histidine kinase